MSNRTWRGHWWDPNAPDNSFPGTLHCDESGDLRLELIGGFDFSVREIVPGVTGYRVHRENRDIEIMHGVSGNERFTLLSSSPTHTSGPGIFDGNIAKQDWRPNRALRGVHLESVNSPIFIRAHLQLERLIHWSGRTAFSFTSEDDKEGSRKRRLEKVPAEPSKVEHKEMTVSLRILANNLRYDDRIIANERVAGGREWAVLTCTPKTPAACMDFDQIQKDLQDLLTLSSYNPCGALSRSLVYEAGERVKEVEVMGRQIYRTPPSSRKPSGEMILSLSDVNFIDIVPKWLDLKDRVRTGCNILFGLRYIEKGYIGTRLLGVATAAESMHSALRSATSPIPRSEYRRLKKKILEAIADEDEGLISFVKMGLRNNPTYNERMLELASIPDSASVDLLLGDRQEWATALRRSRNDLAHANERSSNGVETSQAFHLMEVTYALLCLVLLSELGVSPEVQRRAVEENARISFLSGEYRNSLIT
ncbi:HEPN domain-containing protein [Streptomyces sp. M54]|uniref:ApeA N-terminal domain 1-containing protein n=1 Tax=Streptomyces sp. M54 TaxID=2759525 RepID=UPI001A8D1AEA|nr:HEPN domain-containing protein [Streptomyces sp. M54]QSS91686.1 hypothetical protein H3V39_15520 [Streptomyces sp. M54]